MGRPMNELELRGLCNSVPDVKVGQVGTVRVGLPLQD